MFTNIQLQQLQELLRPLWEGQNELRTSVDGIKGDIKNVKGEIVEIKDSVHELKGDVNGLKGDVNGLKDEVQKQGKTVKSVKTKLNHVAKTVDVIARSYNAEIVDNKKRIEKLEDSVSYLQSH
ncbi:MAG: hypothetical protein AAB553_05320 [Patescibacteria group bacterium]